MRNLFTIMITITVVFILTSCASTTKEIARRTVGTRTDVFIEVPEGNAPAGFVDLVINASIKTPLEGYYALKPKGSAHVNPGYPFLVNIDGQAVVWTGEGRKETIPLYDENGKTTHDPDAGAGMKYILEKKVRLSAGLHEFFFGLPRETYYTKVQLTLKEDGPSMLEFKPRYRYKTIPTRIPTFLNGISSYEIILNGQSIRQQ